jgi:hypothetical protein
MEKGRATLGTRVHRFAAGRLRKDYNRDGRAGCQPDIEEVCPEVSARAASSGCPTDNEEWPSNGPATLGERGAGTEHRA